MQMIHDSLYPLDENASKIKKHIRSYIDGCFNLTRCELIHPDLDIIYKNMPFFDLTKLNQYPDIELASNRLSALLGIPSENMIFTGGSDSISAYIMNALGQSTKRVILQTPNYFGWRNNAILNKLQITEVEFGVPKKYTFCLENFIYKLQTNNQSLVVISNPNNPTGFTFTKNEIIALSNECERYGHMLIIDECFSYFSEIDHQKLLGIKEHILYVRSFSKCFGLAGARVAVIIGSVRLMSYLSKWRPDSTISYPALFLLENILMYRDELRQISRSIIQAKDDFISILTKEKPNWKALPSGANFVTFFLKDEKPEDIVIGLKQRGFLIKDVSSFSGLDGCIRIGIAHSKIMNELINAILDLKMEKI